MSVAGSEHSLIGATFASCCTSSAARPSHFAYASGKAERCTVCAATVTGNDSQPGTSSSRSMKIVVL